MIQSELPMADPSPFSVDVACLRAEQPIGDIYIASMPFELIREIAHFDVRRRLQIERDVERYLGVQRPLDDKRVDRLKQYVNFIDASFPTSIILAIEDDFCSYDESRKLLTLSNCRKGDTVPSTMKRNLARVLDGQHRIAGLAGFSGKRFDVSVTIFIGADISDQAHIFSTVNLEQTKVNKSLAYDLFELSAIRSPQKTCHNIAIALDRDETSPFFKRIKRLGIATDDRDFEPISQANFVDGIIKYVSSDPKADRDILLRGLRLPKRITTDSLIFRDLFIAEKEIEITEIVYNYFCAVREKWPKAWAARERGQMLNRTNGFRALIRYLKNAYLSVAGPNDVPSTQAFLKAFDGIGLSDEDFTISNFPPGTGGEALLLKILRGERELQL